MTFVAKYRTRQDSTRFHSRKLQQNSLENTKTVEGGRDRIIGSQIFEIDRKNYYRIRWTRWMNNERGDETLTGSSEFVVVE